MSNIHGNKRIAMYTFPDDHPNEVRRGEILEWEYVAPRYYPKWLKDIPWTASILGVFEQFKQTMMEQEYHQPNENGEIDWDNHVHPTQEEIDRDYQLENFEIRCYLCWGKVFAKEHNQCEAY